MAHSLKFLAASMAFVFLCSFSEADTHAFIGTFGVSGDQPGQVTLTINQDHTFSYQDFSDSDNKIAVKGKWTVKGKKVTLQSNDSDVKFHDVWSFTEDGQIAKSRKGLSFYRLCKTDDK